MKKWLGIVLALSVLLTLCACGGESNDASSDGSESTASVVLSPEQSSESLQAVSSEPEIGSGTGEESDDTGSTSPLFPGGTVGREISFTGGTLYLVTYVQNSVTDVVTLYPDGGEPIEIYRGGFVNPNYLLVSPDCKQIIMNNYSLDGATTVRLYNMESGQLRKLSIELPEYDTVGAMGWLDDRYFLFASHNYYSEGSSYTGGDVYYYDTETDACGRIIRPYDSSYLVVHGFERQESAMRFTAAMLDGILNFDWNKYYTVSYDTIYELIRNGKEMVFEEDEGEIAPLPRVQNPDLSFPDGEILRQFPVENGTLYLVHYPDGRDETGSLCFDLVMHALDNGELIEVRRFYHLNPNYFLLSPDGKHLLMNTFRQNSATFLYLYDVENIQNRRLDIKLTDYDTVSAMCWLDNRYLLFVSQDPTDDPNAHGGDVYYYDTEKDVYNKLIGTDSERLQVQAFLPSEGSMQFKAVWNTEEKYYTVSYEDLYDLIRNGKKLVFEADKGADAPAVPKPIDNTGVPEEFWECENVVADLESFAIDNPWNDTYDACGEMRGRAYSFLNIYLSGDKSKASLLVDVDDACLARIPEGGSAYGSFDDMEHFYFKDLRCFYGVDRKTDRAWMKTVFALKGQFYELTLSLETKESANQWNVYSSWWSIVDFEVVETEIDPAELQTDVVALQDLAFRYFKAYCHGDGKAAKSMVADPDDTEQNALAYCEKKYVSLQDTTFHVGILIDDQNRVEVDITFSDEEDLKAWYMVLCLTAEEVKDDAGNVIDRVWKITDCGIDA